MVSSTEPSFEEYFTFQTKIDNTTARNEEFSFVDEYSVFQKAASEPVWRHFIQVFNRPPSFEDYTNFVTIREGTNWVQYECEQPKFEIYLQYVLERDSVAFDWLQICGHVPTLLEYIVYLGNYRLLRIKTGFEEKKKEVYILFTHDFAHVNNRIWLDSQYKLSSRFDWKQICETFFFSNPVYYIKLLILNEK